MLARPAGLTDAEVVDAVRAGWGIEPTTIAWQPVGFGSHHWIADDRTGGRWFVTVDDLDASVCNEGLGRDDAFGRLASALGVAVQARAAGRRFAVAPVLDDDGHAVRRLGDRFALAVFPHVDGRARSWGDHRPLDDRLSTLDLVIELHSLPAEVAGSAPVDRMVVPRLDEVLAASRSESDRADGPFERRARRLLVARARHIDELAADHQAAAAHVLSDRGRFVLTHGEPHAGNTIEAPDGWYLVDWDTARVAAPERDLWLVAEGALEVLERYTERTGREVDPVALAAYEGLWRLTDVTLAAAALLGPHADDADAAKSWEILEANLT